MSKFDQTYRLFFERLTDDVNPDPDEEAPDISKKTSSEDQSEPTGDSGEEDNSSEGGNSGEDEKIDPNTLTSQLPDPKEVKTVTIDLINKFIDFLNLPKEEQEKFLKRYDFQSHRANENNIDQKLEDLESIVKSEYPDKATL